MADVECSLELGKWTVRVNGHFIYDSFWEARARRVAMRLQAALDVHWKGGTPHASLSSVG